MNRAYPINITSGRKEIEEVLSDSYEREELNFILLEASYRCLSCKMQTRKCFQAFTKFHEEIFQGNYLCHKCIFEFGYVVSIEQCFLHSLQFPIMGEFWVKV